MLPKPRPYWLPRTAAKGLMEIYRGVEREIGKGMAFGTVIGACAGAWVGYGLSGISISDGPENGEPDRLQVASVCGFALGFVGTLVGAGIGALHGDERWEKVPLGCIRAGIAPQRGGVRLAASFRF